MIHCLPLPFRVRRLSFLNIAPVQRDDRTHYTCAGMDAYDELYMYTIGRKNSYSSTSDVHMAHGAVATN
jgi:hypothetical protein